MKKAINVFVIATVAALFIAAYAALVFVSHNPEQSKGIVADKIDLIVKGSSGIDLLDRKNELIGTGKDWINKKRKAFDNI